jgi:hypothetical protein
LAQVSSSAATVTKKRGKKVNIMPSSHAVRPRDQRYKDMLCPVDMMDMRVTGVPTQDETHRQAGRNTTGSTTPQTFRLESRVTGVPTQVEAHR